jgi:hypothetical protein
MPILIVYFLQQDNIIIVEKMPRVKILLNIIPPRPLLPRKNFTIVTFEKLISNELLLNLIPAIIAQKIHTQIIRNIKIANLRCFFNGSNNGYEKCAYLFIQ